MSSEHTLARETEAAKLLVQQLRELGLEDDTALVADTIEGETDIAKAIASVIDSIVLVDQINLDGIEVALRDLKSRALAIETRIDRKRIMVLTAMQLADRKSIVTPLRTVTVKSVPAKVIITDESLLPTRFFLRPEPVVDKARVNTAVREWGAEYSDAIKLTDIDERNAALALLEVKRIGGTELSNAGETLQIS